MPFVLLAIGVPPQEPANNSQMAPVPSKPPLTVIIALESEQMDEGLILSDVGATELELTTIIASTQLVVLQVPDASTK